MYDTGNVGLGVEKRIIGEVVEALVERIDAILQVMISSPDNNDDKNEKLAIESFTKPMHQLVMQIDKNARNIAFSTDNEDDGDIEMTSPCHLQAKPRRDESNDFDRNSKSISPANSNNRIENNRSKGEMMNSDNDKSQSRLAHSNPSDEVNTIGDQVYANANSKPVEKEDWVAQTYVADLSISHALLLFLMKIIGKIIHRPFLCL